MAIEAPLHQQGRSLENQRHLIHGTVARRAAYALVDVNAVIEIDEIGQPVHFHPLNRLVGAIAFPHRLEIARVIEQHGVAIHTGFRRRNTRNRGGFHTGVTVAAVDAVVADMVLVTELDRLLARNVLIRRIRRAGHSDDGRDGKSTQKNG